MPLSGRIDFYYDSTGGPSGYAPENWRASATNNGHLTGAPAGTAAPGSASSLGTANRTRFLYFAENGLLEQKLFFQGCRSHPGRPTISLTIPIIKDAISKPGLGRGMSLQPTIITKPPGVNTGELSGITVLGYDSTTQLYVDNRMGHLSTVVDACGTRSFVYRASDQQLDHQVLPSTVRRRNAARFTNYDGLSRPSGYWLGISAGTAQVSANYQYYGDNASDSDQSGRLKSIISPLGTFNYTFIFFNCLGEMDGPSSGAGEFADAQIHVCDRLAPLDEPGELGRAPFPSRFTIIGMIVFHRLQAIGQTGAALPKLWRGSGPQSRL